MPQAAAKGRLFSLSFFSSFYGFEISRAKIGKLLTCPYLPKPLEAFCPYLFWKVCFYNIGYQLFVKFCHKVLSIRFWGWRWEKNKKGQPFARPAFCSFPFRLDYIIPSIPPPMGMGGVGGVGSLWLLMTHSVVSNMPAMLAAFSKATRDTFTGSMTPVSSRFS